jgi:hypothetical protein
MSNYNNTTKINHNDVNYTVSSQYDVKGGGLGDEGLSTYHNPRNDIGNIEVFIDGSLLKVSRGDSFKLYRKKKKREVDWKRGKISSFSSASRRRLMRKLAMINKTDLPLFITLTYPNHYPDDAVTYKAHLEKFIKRLKYRFPNVSGIWKLEFQARGAPHYHIFVWGLPEVDLRDFISNQWYEVVKSGDIKHLRAGTQIARVRSWRGVMSYASKYMGKKIEGEFEVGRFWGCFYPEKIPWSRIEKYKVFDSQVLLAMRYMRRYAGIRSRSYPSLSIYVNDPEQWKRALLC